MSGCLHKISKEVIFFLQFSLIIVFLHHNVYPDEYLKTVTYRGIKPTDPMGRCGLRNPERGFRTETLIAEPSGRIEEVWGIPAHLKDFVGPGFSPSNWVMDIQRFEHDGVTLTQAYCYLTEYYDSPIPGKKIKLLEESFNIMRKIGIKCVLRFAYIKDYPIRISPPDYKRILQHIKQLKPVLHANADVIHTLEAGFIAAWGEWHSRIHIVSNDKRKLILEKILDMVPGDIFVQVRFPGYKKQLIPFITGLPYRNLTENIAFSNLPEARVGFHNDGILTKPKSKEEYVFALEPVEYGDLREETKKETLFVPMGGELFWSDEGWFGEGKYYRTFDGLEVACHLRDFHYNVLSIAHSYSEREGKILSIDHWRCRLITKEQLESAKLPISKDWFIDSLGNEVPRTQFEYIRDHLGYRIELQHATFTPRISSGGKLKVIVSLINRGFSTLFNPRPVEFVLIDVKENMYSFPVDNIDPRKWYPHKADDTSYIPLVHTISAEIDIPDDLPEGYYSLGLWLPDKSERLRNNPYYAIRVANGDVPFWTSIDGKYGINLLGTVQKLSSDEIRQ